MPSNQVRQRIPQDNRRWSNGDCPATISHRQFWLVHKLEDRCASDPVPFAAFPGTECELKGGLRLVKTRGEALAGARAWCSQNLSERVSRKKRIAHPKPDSTAPAVSAAPTPPAI